MKKFLPILFMVLSFGLVRSQNSFSDDFDSYTPGAFLGTSSTVWTTWSGVKGGADDTRVSNEQAHSGTNSIKFLSTSASGGPADVILPFGGRRTDGTFTLEMWMYVIANKGAYFNFQGNATVGQIWSLGAHFDPNGDVRINSESNSQATLLSGKHPKNTWFSVKVVANLTDNNWEVFIDNVSIGSFSNPNNAVASMDIYPTSTNNQSEYFIDDVSYTFEPFVAPNRDASLTGATVRPKGLTGSSSSASIKIKNVGMTTITSADVEWSVNGGPVVQENYTLNLNFLQESAALPLSQNVSYPAGLSNLEIVIKAINGSADDKAENNTRKLSLEGVTPAPDKKIVVEEATGTWCQWCPRGAVYLDSLTKLYPEHFIGIAVHNRDPMAVTEYDLGMTSFPGFTGFPQVVTNRRTLSDPSAIEPIFYDQIIELTPVRLDVGAAYDPNTSLLKIEAKAEFTEDLNGDYRFNLVVVEDDVRGTSSGYNQSNAYAGGGSGVMGGYELLPNPVPASRMVYNHVGRAILDTYYGVAGYLPNDILANSTYIKSYDYTVPATFKFGNLKLVAMMLDPNGEIINANEVTIDDALATGLFTANEDIDLSSKDVILSPNPANEVSWLHFNLENQSAEVALEVIDMFGKTIARKDYGNLSGVVDLEIQTSLLNNGHYVLRLNVNSKLTTKKLFVNH